MINKESLDLFLNSIYSDSFLTNNFSKELFTSLKKDSRYTYLKSICISDRKSFILGEYYEGNIILYKRNIEGIYNSKKEIFIKNEDNLFIRNIFSLFTIIHELSHCYQETISDELLRKLYILSYSIKEGDNISNKLIKVLDLYNIDSISSYIKRNEGNKLYRKFHYLFPIEVHADGMSYDFILNLYNLIGSDIDNNILHLKEYICKSIMNNYIFYNDKVINSLKRFFKLINMEELYGQFDFNYLTEYERVLFSLEENPLVVDKVSEKILAK